MLPYVLLVLLMLLMLLVLLVLLLVPGASITPSSEARTDQYQQRRG